MFLSVFELFKIGIGPSSSHTMGPMVAASRFIAALRASPFQPAGLRVRLHGSLAFTGIGHATDRATILGLAGFEPATYDAQKAERTLAQINETGVILNAGLPPLAFDAASDLVFDYGKPLPGHANGMVIMATDAQGDVILQETYYSTGGGFVSTEAELADQGASASGDDVPYPFRTAAEMLAMCAESGKSIAGLKRANELESMGPLALDNGLARIWEVMNACIERGMATDGILPGGLSVKRRAKGIREKLIEERGMNLTAPHTINDWMTVYAMAVNEENAVCGRGDDLPSGG
ncbi:MAG: serine dehydratase beta chain, partial [Pseudomonadota bacterium]